MNTSKVEICGVNTALLPVLNEEQKTHLLLAAKAGNSEPKHDAGTATRHYRAFWQRRCRAAAAEAVLKPLGGNCAVLPYKL